MSDGRDPHGLAFDFPQGWLPGGVGSVLVSDSVGIAADTLTKNWLQDLEELEGPLTAAAAASEQGSQEAQVRAPCQVDLQIPQGFGSWPMCCFSARQCPTIRAWPPAVTEEASWSAGRWWSFACRTALGFPRGRQCTLIWVPDGPARRSAIQHITRAVST